MNVLHRSEKLVGQIHNAWRANEAQPDLLEEIKALGFKPDPVSFSQKD